MSPSYQLLDQETAEVLVEQLEIADSHLGRFVGWMFRSPRSNVRSGILLKRCRSIHTMWMRVSIDVAFLSDDLQVLQTRKRLSPWRIAIAPRGTHSVLETPSGQNDLRQGQRLSISADEDPAKLY